MHGWPKRLTLSVLIVGALSFCLCVTASVAAGSGKDLTLRILYVNDFHGRLEPQSAPGSKGMVGGAEALATRIDQLRKGKKTLLLAGGDMISGPLGVKIVQGKAVIDVMNAMRFDAMVVGNHDFDFGINVLKQRIQDARFPILGANVAGFPEIKPHAVIRADGLKIALIGVTTPDIAYSSRARNIAGLAFEPPEEAVEKYVGDLQGQADLFIVLSHLGYAADRELAQNVDGIHVIVGGHSHTRIERPVTVNQTIIVQAAQNGEALGVLDLTIKQGKIVSFRGRLEEVKTIPQK